VRAHLEACQRSGFDEQSLRALQAADPLVHRQLLDLLASRAQGASSADLRDLQQQLAQRAAARRQRLAACQTARAARVRAAAEEGLARGDRPSTAGRLASDTRAAARDRRMPFAAYAEQTHNVRAVVGVAASARKAARQRLREQRTSIE
jgi:hypothetical protein